MNYKSYHEDWQPHSASKYFSIHLTLQLAIRNIKTKPRYFKNLPLIKISVSDLSQQYKRLIENANNPRVGSVRLYGLVKFIRNKQIHT